MSWSRSAFWLGEPREGEEDALEVILRRDLVPAMRGFADVKDAKFLWPREREHGSPQIYFQSILEFADRDAIERLNASPERLALRPKVAAALALFEGIISHINYENA